MKKLSLPSLVFVALAVLAVFAIGVGARSMYDIVFFDVVQLNQANFQNPSATFITTMKASGSLATNWTLTLPTTAGSSGQILRTDGSGITSWVTVGGAGSVTNFSFTNANGITGVVTNPTTTPNLTLTLNAITPSSVTASGNIISTGGNLQSTAGSVLAPAGNLSAGTAGSTTGSLVLSNITGANSTSIQAGASAPTLTYILPTVAPTAGQFFSAAAPSGVNVQTSWTSPSSLGLYQGTIAVDIKSTYNASGSNTATTGTIGAGSSSLTLASAIDFSNGQGINIATAGTAGVNCVRTILSGGGTVNITLNATCPSAATGAAVNHDDSAAINAYLAASTAGHKGLLKAGHYMVSGPLQAACNAILCYPQVLRTAEVLSIGLIGEFTPTQGGVTLSSNGVIIDASLWNDSTPANHAAIIAAKTYALTDNLSTAFNYVVPEIQDITFRGKPNPVLDGVMMNNAIGMRMRHVVVDQGEPVWFNIGVGLSPITQPTNAGVEALVTPGINNFGDVEVNQYFTWGYYVGLKGGEHIHFTNTPQIFFSRTGWECDGGAGDNTGSVLITSSKFGISAPGIYAFAPLCIFNDTEVYIETSGGTGQWYDTAAGQSLSDASNNMLGSLQLLVRGSFATPTRASIANGAAKVSWNDIAKGKFGIASNGGNNLTLADYSTDNTAGSQFQIQNDGLGSAIGTLFVAGSAYVTTKLRNNLQVNATNSIYFNVGTSQSYFLDVNGTDLFQFTSTGQLTFLTDVTAVSPYSIGRASSHYLAFSGGDQGYGWFNAAGGAAIGAFDASGNWETLSTGSYAFTNGASAQNGTIDGRLARFGVGILEIDNGTACSTAANCVDLTLRHSLANGTAPTIASGFGSGSTIAGRDEAARVTLGTTPGTGGVVTFGTAYTNAPVCTANDETTLTVTLTTTPTTTNVTVTAVGGVILSADKIGIQCKGYR